MHINHRLQIIQHSADSLQFGIGAQSLILEGLTADDHRLVEALRTGTGARSLENVAARCGLHPARARYLADLLKPVLIETIGKESALCGLRADRLAADILQWSVVYERDATPLIERRARSVVRVIGLGRTGSAIAQALASAGLGTLLLEDDALVAPSDVSAAAFRLCDVGLSRSAAVRRQIHHIDPTIQTHVLNNLPAARPNDPAFFAVDLVITTNQDLPDRQLLSALMDHGQAHLPVLLRERDILIGPLVIPGETACVQCIDRHLADMNPQRPDRRERLKSAAAEGICAAAEETALAFAAASTAVLQTLLFVDGVHRPSSWSTVLQVRAADGSSFQRSYEPHPRCGCAEKHPHRPGPG